MSAPLIEKGLLTILNERISEQREVSRFLHDTLAQDLVALSFTLSRLESLGLSGAAVDEVHSAIALIDGCCSQFRIVDAILASSVFDGSAADAVIEQLAALLRDETHIPITLDLDPAAPLGDRSRMLLLTVVRACFALVVRRRSKSAIVVRLRNQEHRVVLNVEVSPPPPGSLESWTLFRGCAASLGGDFAVQTMAERFSACLSLPGEPRA